MTRPAFVQVQKQQQAKFMCSACGADRGCNCNAPAVEKLAEKLEQDRQRARKARAKKTLEKSTSASRDDFKWSEPIEVEDEVEVTSQELWQNSVHNMATDAISLRTYWTNNFGSISSFGFRGARAPACRLPPQGDSYVRFGS